MTQHYGADANGVTTTVQAVLADAARHSFSANRVHDYLDSLEGSGQNVDAVRTLMTNAGYTAGDADTMDSASFGYGGADGLV